MFTTNSWFLFSSIYANNVSWQSEKRNSLWLDIRNCLINDPCITFLAFFLMVFREILLSNVRYTERVLAQRREKKKLSSCGPPGIWNCSIHLSQTRALFTQSSHIQHKLNGQSFVRKTRSNLCQTNELNRPTREVNTRKRLLCNSAVIILALFGNIRA